MLRAVLSAEVPSDDTDLIESGLIDSLAIVTIIAETEQEFGVEFPLDDLDVNEFRSVERIVQSLARIDSGEQISAGLAGEYVSAGQ